MLYIFNVQTKPQAGGDLPYSNLKIGKSNTPTIFKIMSECSSLYKILGFIDIVSFTMIFTNSIKLIYLCISLISKFTNHSLKLIKLTIYDVML